MLSYQHIYHAGNFADVHKHALLLAAVTALKTAAGATPLTVIDTHAGRGIYDLSAVEAAKNSEFKNGIGALWEAEHLPGLLSPYRDLVGSFNIEGRPLRHYPGSAAIAQSILRRDDRLIAVEKHPGEFKSLTASLSAGRGIELLRGDGIDELAKLTATAFKGPLLAIIDPSYEIKAEYDTIPAALLQHLKTCPSLSVFLWVPLMDSGGHERLLSALGRGLGKTPAIVASLRLVQPPEKHFRMGGTAVVMINPPVSEKDLRACSDALAAAIPGVDRADVKRIS